MMAGRTLETRKRLIYVLFARLEADMGLAPHDVEVCIQQSPPENWGFRGKTGDEIALSYAIKV